MITKIFGTHDANTLAQITDVASRARYAALMPDGHLGMIAAIGSVAAYDNMISVAGVGADIGCGNCAIRTDVSLESLTGISHLEIDANPFRLQSNRVLTDLADSISRDISFGIGTRNDVSVLSDSDPLWHDGGWWTLPNELRDTLQILAKRQLGTVGSGNHYVDVLVDENGMLWVGVHFGSRGLGHKIASNVMGLSVGKNWGEKFGAEVEALLPLDSELGQTYWALMTIAGRYAFIGREWVTRTVMAMFGGVEQDIVHNNHNFAWKEQHFGQELIVVRKGATPAFPGQRGFVGGSMGDDAVILQGTDSPASVDALHSTVHGAGRVMSRTAAAGKRHRKTGAVIKVGAVSPADMKSWLDRRGVILRGAGLDESPQAYRRLPDVLADAGDTVTVLHTLRPIIVVMAGADETE